MWNFESDTKTVTLLAQSDTKTVTLCIHLVNCSWDCFSSLILSHFSQFLS